MTPKPHLLRDRRGLALVMAILVIFICSAILMGLTSYTVSEYRATHLDERRVQALYCAEAGVEYALDFLRLKQQVPQHAVTMAEAGLPDAEGEFRITTTPVTSGAVSDPGEGIRVSVTGYVPSEQAVREGRGVERTVVAIVAPGTWDFGMDAVRSKKGISYGSNEDLTVVCNNLYQPVSGSGVNASIRVTGYAGNESIAGSGTSDANVHGNASAPGQVRVRVGDGWEVSQGPENYIPHAFPSNEEIGFDADGDLIWPPSPDTLVGQYLMEAEGGGTIGPGEITSPMTIQAPKYVNLYGGDLRGVITFRGPGTVVVNGNCFTGGNLKIYNGPPAATLVITGDFRSTAQNDEYHGDPGSDRSCPPLIVLGTEVSDRGQGTWHLNGPLMALNPNVDVEIWSSAVGITGNSSSNDSYDLSGAIISNGTVSYNGRHSVLAFPQRLEGQRFTTRTPLVVRSYSAQ